MGLYQILLTKAHHDGLCEEDAARRLMAYGAGLRPLTLPPLLDLLESAKDAQRQSADGAVPRPLLRRIVHSVEAIFSSAGFLSGGFETSTRSSRALSEENTYAPHSLAVLVIEEVNTL